MEPRRLVAGLQCGYWTASWSEKSNKRESSDFGSAHPPWEAAL